VQTGETDDLTDPPSEFRHDQEYYLFKQHLEHVGFESTTSYEESLGGFLGGQAFVVAFKDLLTEASWYANQAEIDLRVADRGLHTVHDETSLFRHFDGATMMNFQYPSRIMEELFCRETRRPSMREIGDGFGPKIPNLPVSTITGSENMLFPSAERGVFSQDDFANGTSIAVSKKPIASLLCQIPLL
jgi:hypothetical protein